jgi:hypothetical protein
MVMAAVRGLKRHAMGLDLFNLFLFFPMHDPGGGKRMYAAHDGRRQDGKKYSKVTVPHMSLSSS